MADDVVVEGAVVSERNDYQRAEIAAVGEAKAPICIYDGSHTVRGRQAHAGLEAESPEARLDRALKALDVSWPLPREPVIQRLAVKVRRLLGGLPWRR